MADTPEKPAEQKPMTDEEALAAIYDDPSVAPRTPQSYLDQKEAEDKAAMEEIYGPAREEP